MEKVNNTKQTTTTTTKNNEAQPTTQTKHPIAILGYSYRLPGGIEDDQALFDLLASRGYVQERMDVRYGKNEIPWDGFVDSPSKCASPYEGLITGGKELEFDCPLFGMSPHDAKRMDPQIKMMLMVTWEALQHAGMDQVALHNSNTGCFIGYQTAACAAWRSPYGATSSDIPGRSGSMIANRISYHFNWMGPSFGVATACSSGVTSLDAAVKSLNVRECDVAIFGAVSYLGFLLSSVGFNALGIVSHTGTSRSFSADANGYMRSEGAFIYVLKRLDDAERDGDRIFGVIRGVGLNTAGAELDADILTSGRMIVAPVGHAQQTLMETIADEAGVDKYDVDYIEAHATGTPVGDAIEGNAIANAYGGLDRPTNLRVASSRSNFGHMEASSFTLSMLKVLMMMQRKVFLPISSHFKERNPNIPWDEKKMAVQTDVEPFPQRDDPILMGINSFGFGGANGHCILQEYKSEDVDDWSVLPGGDQPEKFFCAPFSAKSEDALVENARRLIEKLPELESDVDAYTLVGNLSTRMTPHRIRTAFAVQSVPDLQKKLTDFVDGYEKGTLPDGEIQRVSLKSASSEPDIESDGPVLPPTIAMIFPGQGSQWAGCGKELYKTELIFRNVVDAIDKEWIALSGGTKLSDVAFNAEFGDELNEVKWAQPVTFLLQVAMFEMMKSYGVYPNVVLGHSAGEAAAAYASGAYTLEEACYLVYNRSRQQAELAGTGRMLVLMMDRPSVETMLDKYGFTTEDGATGDKVVDLACFNSPGNTVVCGPATTIAMLQEALETDGQPKGKLIPGNIAFHSRWTTKIKDDLIDVLECLKEPSPKIPFLSTVTAGFLSKIDADYWWQNVRKPVNLLGAMNVVRTQVQPDIIIELSPHITLRSPVRDAYSAADTPMPPYIFSLVKNVNTAESFANTIGRCFKAGNLVDFKTMYPRPRPMTHLLPHYAMNPVRVIDDFLDDGALLKMEAYCAGPFLGRHMQADGYHFQNMVSKQHYTWMADHVVQGQPLVPAAAYIELLMEAFEGQPIHVHSARFLHPFVLADQAKYIHTDIVPLSHAPDTYDFKITSRDHGGKDAPSMLHCIGVVEKANDKMLSLVIPAETPRNLSGQVGNYDELLYEDTKTFYDHMTARIGDEFAYGPYFQGIKRVERDVEQQRLRVEIQIDRTRWENWDRMGYVMHPSVLDGALQIFLVYVMEIADFGGVPQMMLDFVLLQKPSCEKIVCVYDPPEYMRKGMHIKGQVAFGLGERSAGRILIYDGETGELCALVGDYTSFTQNKKRPDLKTAKHYLSWQPKEGCSSELVAPTVTALSEGTGIEEAATKLMEDIMTKAHPTPGVQFFANVAECVIGDVPSQLVLDVCADTLTDASVQYSLLAGESQTDFLTETYKKYSTSHKDAHMRFFHSTETEEDGFLREAMFELFVARISKPEASEGQEEQGGEDLLDVGSELARVSKYVVPGGVLLVEASEVVEAPPKFTCMWEGKVYDKNIMVLVAPPMTRIESLGKDADETMVVVDDTLGFSEYWRQGREATPEPDFDKAPAWTRVDYFAMQADVDSDENIDLFDSPSKLTEFVKKFSSRRSTPDAKSVPCVFTVYTSGAVLNVSAPCQTGVWGAIRSIALELSEPCNTDFRIVDVKTKEDLCFVRGLERMRERELAVQDGKVWTSRLLNDRQQFPVVDMGVEDETPFRLNTENSGVIAELEFKTRKFLPLGPEEVEIAVKGSALNFRDIMVGLGRLPLLSYERSALGRTVGIECSGVIAKVGSEVTRHKVGDPVIAMQGGCVANRLRCHQWQAFPKPENLSFEQGASVISVYVTAYYSLIHLAQIGEGTTILVHSAMGGVGQAAIALAKLKGAKVYGTAGSEAKRKALRDMGCLDAFDSHSTDWYPDLMEATGGRGVDVVLNSLAGIHVDLCLKALAAGGWHCEIGKVDIFADRPVRLAVFRKNLTYRAVDIDRLMMDNPRLSAYLTTKCLELLADGQCPPLPITEFSYAEYQDAITCMMNGQHRGKLVLTPPKPGQTISVVDDRDLFGYTKDGQPRTVVLTGCMGGFGLRMVAFVMAMGADYVFVFDRDPERKRSVKWLSMKSYVSFAMEERTNVKMHITYAEVANYDHCKRAMKEIKDIGYPPVGSVIHLAGVLDDKYVADIDRDSFAKVYAPKAGGAWNLHRATQDCDLQHFIMVSSTSSTFGNPGQTNYSAANSFQDGLAGMRRAQGKHALSFCMGAVVETGMASRNPALLRMMKANGLPAISCIFAMQTLDSALRQDKHYVSVAALAHNLGADVETNDFLRAQAQLVRNNAAFKLGKGGVLSKEAIMDMIAGKVAQLCGVDKVENSEPLSTFGLNSISVAELVAFLKQDMGYTVSAMELMTSATVEAIADGIIKASTKSEETEEAAGEGEGEAEKEAEEAVEEFDRTLRIREPSKFAPKLEQHYVPTSRIPRQVDFGSVKKTKSATRTLVLKKAQGQGLSGSKKVYGQIDGKLPPACQETLSLLSNYMKSFDASSLPPPAPVKQIRKVILTGATGFVGRHFIPLLLQRTEPTIEKVYCPIRADNDEKALERLIAAMNDGNLWDESYRGRICAFASDMNDENFGTSSSLYEEMSTGADAIYHFAANLNLAATFDEMRDSNNITMRPVIKVCLTGKRKHLFLGSTVGMFPQYFCLFANEMATKPIGRDAMPEIGVMKRLFPLFVGGYVWSKLINELLCYEMARVKSIPLAVFRMPNMYANSSTGFTAPDDPIVRLTQAVMQTRMAPGRERPIIVEDSHVCNQMILNISLNPERRNVIYNCSRQSHQMPSESSTLDMLGYKLESTTYETFKDACMKIGEASPLHGYWVLMDHFSSYWIRYKTATDPYPIDVSTCDEDCVPMPPRPNGMEVLRINYEWMDAHPKLWPFDLTRFAIDFDAETMLTPSKKLCEQYDLDFDECIPPFVRDGLRRVCEEIKPPPAYGPGCAFALTSRLETRVNLLKLFKMHPEIEEEEIVAPVFILGLNRTGTTFLHRMLVASGCFAAPQMEEQGLLPPAEQLSNPTDEMIEERLEFLRDSIRDVTESFEGIHETGVGVAEEDMCGHSHSFMSLEYDLQFDLPKYREWLDEQSLDDVYVEHKKWMQFISWSRKRAGNPVTRWCFKLPWHARSLDSLLKVYPDAVLVHTHRNVKDVAGSWFSLVESQRIRAFGTVDREAMAKSQVSALGRTLSSAMKFRQEHPEHKSKWLDVRFDDLVEGPVDMAKMVLTHAGIEAGGNIEKSMTKYVEDSVAKRSGADKKLHQYELKDYGVEESIFEQGTFAEYHAANF